MAAKNHDVATLDFSESPGHRVEISDVRYSGVKGLSADAAAEPSLRPAISARRTAALQTLRANRHLFTAEAVINRADKHKTP